MVYATFGLNVVAGLLANTLSIAMAAGPWKELVAFTYFRLPRAVHFFGCKEHQSRDRNDDLSYTQADLSGLLAAGYTDRFLR